MHSIAWACKADKNMTIQVPPLLTANGIQLAWSILRRQRQRPAPQGVAIKHNEETLHLLTTICQQWGQSLHGIVGRLWHEAHIEHTSRTRQAFQIDQLALVTVKRQQCALLAVCQSEHHIIGNTRASLANRQHIVPQFAQLTDCANGNILISQQFHAAARLCAKYCSSCKQSRPVRFN